MSIRGLLDSHEIDPSVRAWGLYKRFRYDTRTIAHVMRIEESEADRLLARAMDRAFTKGRPA